MSQDLTQHVFSQMSDRPTKRARTSNASSMRKRGPRKAPSKKFAPRTRYPVYDKDFFPRVAKTELVLDLPSALLTTLTTSTDYGSFYTNVVNGFDFNNKLGLQTQIPHSLNYLLAATSLGQPGPYRKYRVISWTTKITIANDSVYPLDIWFCQSELPTDADTLGEVVKTPGARHLLVGVRGSNEAQTTFSMSGNGAMMTPDIVDGSFEYGTQANVPTQRNYLNYYAQQASIAMRYYITFRHTYRVEFFDRFMPV